MINNNEENKKTSLKIEEVQLNPERNTFENTLRQKFSKEDVIQYFDIINEHKLKGWENILFQSKLPIRDLSNITDADILNEQCHDKQTNRVIRGDIERTRVQESIYMNSYKEYIYQMLIYYINQNNIPYIQGLNEIVGPFMLMKHKLQLSLSYVYKLFVCFIDKFLHNYYHDKDFYSIKSSFSLINLLLKYHDPELFYRLQHCMIFPDLYATSWLMTLFSNKCYLKPLYYLWDKIILFDDTLFPIFFIIALLIINKKKIMKNDTSAILSALSDLEIQTVEEVKAIINFAAELKDSTPNSFYLLSQKLDIFNYDSKYLKKYYEEYKPYNMAAMPIFPNELFSITYNNIIGCLDEKCDNFKKNKNVNSFYKCIYCKDKQIKDKISYIIFDLRYFEREEKDNEDNKENKEKKDNKDNMDNKNIKEKKDNNENKNNKENEDNKDNKENKDNKDKKDNNENKDNNDKRENKANEENKDNKENDDNKEKKENKENEINIENKENKDKKENKEIENNMENKGNKENKENKEIENNIKIKDLKEDKDNKDTKDNIDIKDNDNKINKENKENMDNKEKKDIKEKKDNKDNKEKKDNKENEDNKEKKENKTKKYNKTNRDNKSKKKKASDHPGFLPKSILLTSKELKDKNFPKNILAQYKNEKDNHHFIIITSDTDYYEQYEKQYYKETRRKRSILGVYYHDTKELDLKKVEAKFKDNKINNKEYNLLLEYNNFRKIIDEMNQEEFKHVSYVYGGYKQIHSFAMKHKIDLLEHGSQCPLCKEDNFSFFKFWKNIL